MRKRQESDTDYPGFEIIGIKSFMNKMTTHEKSAPDSGGKRNILLINPSLSDFSQSDLLSQIIIKTLPLGLGYLAGYLLEKGLRVKIIDEQIDFLDEERLQAELAAMDDRIIVGMTCYTLHIKRAIEISTAIKKINPSVKVVLGGIHPTVMPDEIFECMEHVDLVVRGEGEVTFHEVVDAFLNNSDMKDIEGISYRNGSDIVHNPSRKQIRELDSLPPFPYHLFRENYREYGNFGSLVTSRGCPYNCIFCSQRNMTGSSFRFLSNERVADKIELLINEYNQDTILFLDDMILANPLRFIRLLDTIIERGLHKKAGFIAQVRGDSINEKIISKIKEANFVTLSFGMETGAQRILDLIDKKELVQDNINAIKLANKNGIETSATFIFGLPTETREERLLTARLAREIPLDSARFNIATPYPGTRLYQMAKEEGRLNILPNYGNFNVQYYMMGDALPYCPSTISPYVLMFDTVVANLVFHLRWKVVKSMLFSPTIGGNVISLGKNWFVQLTKYPLYLKLGWFILKRFLYLGFRAKIKKTASL